MTVHPLKTLLQMRNKNVLYIFLFLIIIITSCNNTTANHKEINSEEAKKERYRAMTDSTKKCYMELSFRDFVLGDSFLKCLAKAKKDKDYYYEYNYGESSYGMKSYSTGLHLHYPKETSIHLNIKHFKDTIVSIIVEVPDEEVFDTLKQYIFSKYGYREPFDHDWTEESKNSDDITSCYSRSYHWNFQNGKVSLSKVSKKQKDYINQDFSIKYTDKKQEMKYEEYERKIVEKDRLKLERSKEKEREKKNAAKEKLKDDI